MSVRFLVMALTGALAFSAAAAAAGAEGDWLLVEFASSKPPCADVSADERCWGTQGDLAQFEMRAGETLELKTGQDVPPAWVRFRRLWVHSNEIAGHGEPDYSISLEQTPAGARLVVVDDDQWYVQSLPLNEWTRLRSREGHGDIWTRVSAPPYELSARSP